MTRRIQKHHRQSIRLRNRDYAESGAYFVTICTKDRECLLGEIVDWKMNLTEFGRIILDCWNDLPSHYLNIILDAFIIMPNHLHGIVVLTDQASVGARSPRPYKGQSLPKHPTLGMMVAYFKYQSTKKINQISQTPGVSFWQRNYHERVLRRHEINRYRQYIVDNPADWSRDENHPNNIRPTD